MRKLYLVYVLLSLSITPTMAQTWVLVEEVKWNTYLVDRKKPNPWTLPHGKDGRVTISQHPTFLRHTWAPPLGKPWVPCQKTFTTFLNGANDPDSWCDPQTLRATAIEATYIKNVHRFSEKKIKAQFVMRADANVKNPLIGVPIIWQWWHIYNYRIFSCDPVRLYGSRWQTIECVIMMPSTKGLVGPEGEDYTGIGFDFSKPYSGTLDVSELKIYVLN